MNKLFNARLLLAPIALSAFVATWGGWVGLANKTGFGEVNLLPGIVEPDTAGGGTWSTVNLSIALPLGVEAYAAYAMSVWFGVGYTIKAKRFAAVSAVFSLLLAAAGQVSYHVLEAKQVHHAPAWLVGFVSCLPVLVIGMAAALHHLTGERVSGETDSGTRAETSWSRLRDAATGAAVARLNRASETSQAAPDETPAASQAQRDTQRQTVSETPDMAETPSPRVADQASQPTVETRVSAGQHAGTATKPTRDQLVQQVHEMRQETPRPSYAAIGDRLGISKAEAGRLGQEAAKRFGETKPTITTVPFVLPPRDAATASTAPMNGTYSTLTKESS